jgi:alkylation response protein AidB-like acyl-CoA dehydrogenase
VAAITTTTTRTTIRSLSEETLLRFRERAAHYDAVGRFAVEDLADLRAAGWFTTALPEDLGGLGLNLAELGGEQRRIARYSPATALSTCMHHYWVGMAADLYRMGRQCEADLIIGYVADGDILASGHAEVGNDIPVALSTTSAGRVEGGWRITGRKMFGSLGPHWNRLGFHAMDVSDLTAPVVVHAFVPHDAPGLTTVPNWDAQGMRATRRAGARSPDAGPTPPRRPPAPVARGRRASPRTTPQRPRAVHRTQGAGRAGGPGPRRRRRRRADVPARTSGSGRRRRLGFRGRQGAGRRPRRSAA